MIRRALLSVSDKTGLLPFAQALHARDITLISTGGTAKFLRDGGLPVINVADVTGFPEMMDGRIKTLHPKVHGGLLARRDLPAHVSAMQKHGIEPIDLVCINLYPFAQTIAKPDVSFEEAIENIDIGGPSMIRSAAKNHAFVTVVTSPQQYEEVIGQLAAAGECDDALRKQLAQEAFALTSRYDAMISDYLSGAKVSALPATIDLSLKRHQTLRYGENPHQAAAVYVSSNETAGVANAKQLHGKELSYINLLDADAAVACAAEFAEPAACIVKHATPCGVGSDATLADAFSKAYESDALAAFGGIVALNRPVDLATAQQMVAGQKFLEVIVAPAFADDALSLLKDRWKNVRLLQVEAARSLPTINLRSIAGGFLAQQSDSVPQNASNWRVVSKRQPTDSERADLNFAWLACKHVKSNAIVLAKNGATIGIGGGQVDRVGAARIAIEKAAARSKGSVAASDAFFPFADGPKLLLQTGVVAIIQPGGSVRDQETIDAVDAAGATMIFTGTRHFRH